MTVIVYKSLPEYLETKEGRPYSAFWPEAEVRSADDWAAAELQ